MNPEISSVKIFPYKIDKGDYSIVAYADITLGDAVLLRGITIIKTKHEGFFLHFPSKVISNELFEFIKINDPEYSKYMRRIVLDEYKKIAGEENGA